MFHLLISYIKNMFNTTPTAKPTKIGYWRVLITGEEDNGYLYFPVNGCLIHTDMTSRWEQAQEDINKRSQDKQRFEKEKEKDPKIEFVDMSGKGSSFGPQDVPDELKTFARTMRDQVIDGNIRIADNCLSELNTILRSTGIIIFGGYNYFVRELTYVETDPHTLMKSETHNRYYGQKTQSWAESMEQLMKLDSTKDEG